MRAGRPGPGPSRWSYESMRSIQMPDPDRDRPPFRKHRAGRSLNWAKYRERRAGSFGVHYRAADPRTTSCRSRSCDAASGADAYCNVDWLAALGGARLRDIYWRALYGISQRAQKTRWTQEGLTQQATRRGQQVAQAILTDEK